MYYEELEDMSMNQDGITFQGNSPLLSFCPLSIASTILGWAEPMDYEELKDLSINKDQDDAEMDEEL